MQSTWKLLRPRPLSVQLRPFSIVWREIFLYLSIHFWSRFMLKHAKMSQKQFSLFSSQGGGLHIAYHQYLLVFGPSKRGIHGSLGSLSRSATGWGLSLAAEFKISLLTYSIHLPCYAAIDCDRYHWNDASSSWIASPVCSLSGAVMEWELVSC